MPKFKLLGEEIRYLMRARGGLNKQFPPKYLPSIIFLIIDTFYSTSTYVKAVYYKIYGKSLFKEIIAIFSIN